MWVACQKNLQVNVRKISTLLMKNYNLLDKLKPTKISRNSTNYLPLEEMLGRH